MANLTLWFNENDTVSLNRTSFQHPLLGETQLTVRGKTAGAMSHDHSFQWTPAVRALALLCIWSRIEGSVGGAAYLVGERGSPASTLDYAIGKAPNWILDVFGVDKFGRALAKRIIKRTNPERRRPGPVILAFNPKLLKTEEIRIIVNEQEVENLGHLKQIAENLSRYWTEILAGS